jgi:hypothetical protein
MTSWQTPGYAALASASSASATKGGVSVQTVGNATVIRSADWGQPQSHQPTPAQPKKPIGFAPASAPASAPKRCLQGRKAYLRAIEIAAGKVLLAGRDHEAIDAIRRGRLGGRKDNLEALQSLLQRYEQGVAA